MLLKFDRRATFGMRAIIYGTIENIYLGIAVTQNQIGSKIFVKKK